MVQPLILAKLPVEDQQILQAQLPLLPQQLKNVLDKVFTKIQKEMPLPSVTHINFSEVAAYNIGYNDALKVVKDLLN